MNDKIIYVCNPMPESYGVTIIVDNIVSVLNKKGYTSKVIYKIEEVTKDSYIIPYGIDVALDMIKKGYNTNFVFMADAFTLGYINKIKFYLLHHDVFHYDFFYSIYCLLRDYRIETKVLSKFKKIALVSQTDIDYLKKRAKPDSDFFCMPNGANFTNVEEKIKSNNIRLGILSNWWHITLAKENGWFIESYFSEYANTHPNVKLILAGRGSYIERYRKISNVEIMGEIGDLNDFFKNIDICVVVNPKGCGILNRALDAFAYKTCVLGHKNAFTGFRYMDDSFVEFDNYHSFEKQLNLLINDPIKRQTLADNAYKSICKYNNWDVNIEKLVNFILKK